MVNVRGICVGPYCGIEPMRTEKEDREVGRVACGEA